MEKQVFIGWGFSAGYAKVEAETEEEAKNKMADFEHFWACANGNHPDSEIKKATETDLENHKNAPKL